jgi:hypothetical protein
MNNYYYIDGDADFRGFLHRIGKNSLSSYDDRFIGAMPFTSFHYPSGMFAIGGKCLRISRSINDQSTRWGYAKRITVEQFLNRKQL